MRFKLLLRIFEENFASKGVYTSIYSQLKAVETSPLLLTGHPHEQQEYYKTLHFIALSATIKTMVRAGRVLLCCFYSNLFEN